MTNIWEFLLQSLSVVLVAGILFLVKIIFIDKLSPRWQYFVWGILALRILIPVHTDRYLLIPFPDWLEWFKFYCEQGGQSVYSYMYEPLQIQFVFPFISQVPVSLSDWLFVIYVSGMCISLLWIFLKPHN